MPDRAQHNLSQTEIEQIFQSSKCRCGSPKYSGKSFCIDCFLSLPNEMQETLYKPMGKDYEQSLVKCFWWLVALDGKNIYKWGS